MYRYFSKGLEHILDYSDESMLEMYIAETYGGTCDKFNGFYVGKKYLNLTVSMWLEDIPKGLLFKSELYDDPGLPDWWLDKIFKTNKE